MIEIQVDQRVQLIQDIPELGLRRGEVGLVCSTWFSPGTAYEVEFRRKVPECLMRALLMPNQIISEPEGYGPLSTGELR
jgi:hypothetical protein